MWKNFTEKLLEKILQELTSRKWLAFLIVITLSFISLMKGVISGETWTVIVLAGFGLFSAANVAQKIKMNGNGNGDGGKPK